jgi:hypothetical protein
MKFRRVAFVLFAALLTGCSSVSVNYDFDKATDFSSLSTFAWQHSTQPTTGNPRIDNDLLDTRVRRAVESNLTAKKFTMTKREEADFLVAYFIGIDRRISGSGGSASVGMGRSSGSRSGSVTLSSGSSVTEEETGLITIDIIDAKTGRTLWRGTGSRRTSSRPNQQQVTERVNDMVLRILKRFPPK